jgi:hypothetical protein
MTTAALIVDGRTTAVLTEGADALAAALPNAQRRTIAAQGHDANATALAPVLREYFTGTTEPGGAHHKQSVSIHNDKRLVTAETDLTFARDSTTMQHAFGHDIPLTLNDASDGRRLALIVYDMQAGIVSQIATGAAITGRVLEVLESARSAGVRVVFTRHMSLPNEIAGASALRTAGAQPRSRASLPADASQMAWVAPSAGMRSTAVPSPWVAWPLSRAAVTRRW